MSFRSLTAVLFSVAIAAAAQAQTGPAMIDYHCGTHSDPSKVSGDGTNNLKLWNAPPVGVAVTSYATTDRSWTSFRRDSCHLALTIPGWWS